LARSREGEVEQRESRPGPTEEDQQGEYGSGQYGTQEGRAAVLVHQPRGVVRVERSGGVLSQLRTANARPM
jgi:hypothetical protein